MFMRRDYLDSMRSQIVNSPLHEYRRYVYSDLGMILMKDIVETLAGETLDNYVQKHFYTPLSMSHTLFNPLKKFDESQIVPTEEDDYFRNQRLRGHVHDMAASMFGGVSGHAGLFSTTSDLAVLLQMLLNGGEYAGVRYFKPETIQLFTTRQGGSSRRGYGWDLKELNTSRIHNMSPLAPPSTFGHTGFTGNAAFVDPDNQLIFIFLSNRTYPDMNNNKLFRGDYRARIQSAVYEALKR
jgi:CubicO group peptidase (beta-lactamase class C family)